MDIIWVKKEEKDDDCGEKRILGGRLSICYLLKFLYGKCCEY